MTESKSPSSPMQAPGYSIKQRRGQKTYDALVSSGFRLLEKQSFDSITIAELAREAGYSVGAFYSRFRSKDEYFDSLVRYHLDSRLTINRQLFATLEAYELVRGLIEEQVSYYTAHRNFWRAALFRSTRDPEFWAPIRELGNETREQFIDYVNAMRAQPLNEEETGNIQFAFQITRGVINNSILNRPGPIYMEQKAFIESLIRAFLLVSDYEKLLSDKYSRAQGKRARA